MKAWLAVSLLLILTSVVGADVSRQIIVWDNRDDKGSIVSEVFTENASLADGSYIMTWKIGPEDPMNQPTLLDIDLLQISIDDLTFEW